MSAAGLNLLGSFLSFRPSMRPWELRTAVNLLARPAVSRSHRPHEVRPATFFPTCCATRHHAEFGCHGLIPGTTFDELARGFDEARTAGGDFCLATHHWEIDETMAGVLRKFLDYAAGFPDVRFVAAEELFR